MAFERMRAAAAGVIALACLCAAAWASPDVVWTPEQGWQKTGVALDIKGAKDFDRAFSLYLDGKYGKAAGIFKKVIKNGDKALKEEASILLAECHLGQKEYRRAFDQYEKFIKDYPASRWIDRATQGELEIAKATLGGAKVRYLGLKTWAGYGFGEKVVDKITSRRPFSDYARDAQMALAQSYFRRGLYIESASAYRQYVELFGESPGVPDALLGLGRSFVLDARGPAYNPLPYYRASSVASEIQRDYPMSPEADEAVRLKDTAENNLAEHYYIVGKWYLRMGKPDAALVYFNKVLSEYRDTKWAGQAKVRIDSLTEQTRGGNGS